MTAGEPMTLGPGSATPPVQPHGDRVAPGRITTEVRGFGADFIRPGTELSSVIEKG